MPTKVTPNTHRVMPGRAIDIVHGAIIAAGFRPYQIVAEAFNDMSELTDGIESIGVQLSERITEDDARRVFAALGSPPPILGGFFGIGSARLARLATYVPVLGMRVHVLVTDLPAETPHAELQALADAAPGLVAAVDAARSADEQGATVPACPYTHAHTREWCGNAGCRES